MKRLIEFFFPHLYETVERARRAWSGNPVYAEDHGSETNVRFTENLREVTFFWMQDAVVLLARYPGLAEVAPWCTLLESDQCRTDLQVLGEVVNRSIAEAAGTVHTELLHQQELLQSVRAGAATSSAQLNTRLANLPQQVWQKQADGLRERQGRDYEEMDRRIERTVRTVFQQMHLAAAAGAAGRSAEYSAECQCSPSASPGSAWQARPGSRTSSAPPAEDVADVEAEDEGAADEGAADAGEEGPRVGEPPAWVPPVPRQRVEAAAACNRTRKAPPPPDIFSRHMVPRRESELQKLSAVRQTTGVVSV